MRSLLAHSTMLFYALRTTPQFLVKSKVSWRYIILASFISIAFVVAKLWFFKCFRRTIKKDFRLLLGDFLGITPPNTVRFFWNLDQWCSARWSVICNTVLCPENYRKRGQKTDFFFSRNLLVMPCYALWVTP